MQLEYKIIGLRIEHQRSLKKFSQLKIAEACGLSRGTIANIEAGRQKIMLHDLLTIAKFLKVSPVKLLKGISD